MRASSATIMNPCCGRGCCWYLWYGCSFLYHAPPVFMPTDRVTAALSSTYTSSQCSVGYVFFLPTAPPSPCWRCTTHLLRSGQNHHTRLYHGWPARWRHACCSLACPLRDMRISNLPLSHTQRSSAKLAAFLSLPITNHCCRGWVLGPRGSPLLVLLCSWRLLGAFLDLAFARVIDIQCIRPRSPALIIAGSRMPAWLGMYL